MSNLNATVAAHAQAIETLTGDVHAIRRGMTEGFTAVNEALSGLRASLQVREANSLSFDQLIDRVKSLATIIAIGTAAILYVANANNSASNALIAYQMQESVEFRKAIQRERNDELADLRKIFRQKTVTN